MLDAMGALVAGSLGPPPMWMPMFSTSTRGTETGAEADGARAVGGADGACRAAMDADGSGSGGGGAVDECLPQAASSATVAETSA